MPLKKTESNIFSLFFYFLKIVKTEEIKIDFVKWERNGEEFVTVYFKGISSHSSAEIVVSKPTGGMDVCLL
jgi:hypothetical protein